MADNRSTPVAKEVKSFCALIGDVQTMLSDPITLIPNYYVILGIDWMIKTKPHINWDGAILTIQQDKVHHYVYPTNLDMLMKDHVFVKIMEIEN